MWCSERVYIHIWVGFYFWAEKNRRSTTRLKLVPLSPNIFYRIEVKIFCQIFQEFEYRSDKKYFAQLFERICVPLRQNIKIF